MRDPDLRRVPVPLVFLVVMAIALALALGFDAFGWGFHRIWNAVNPPSPTYRAGFETYPITEGFSSTGRISAFTAGGETSVVQDLSNGKLERSFDLDALLARSSDGNALVKTLNEAVRSHAVVTIRFENGKFSVTEDSAK